MQKPALYDFQKMRRRRVGWLKRGEF
jgi:hypothetical protein